MFAFIAVFLWLTLLIPWQAAVLYALVLNTPLSLFAIIAFCDHKQDMLHLAWLFEGVFVVTAATTVALSLLQQGVESDIQTFGVLSFMPAQGLMAVFVALGVLVFTQQRVARKS